MRITSEIDIDTLADIICEEGTREEIQRLYSYLGYWLQEHEYDCPVHGKCGGDDECPRC